MNSMQSNKVRVRLAVAAALLAVAGGNPWAAEVDTSGWVCKRCPDVSGFTGTVGVGTGVVSDEENAFGDYTGRDTDGLIVTSDTAATYFGEGGYTARIDAYALSQDSYAVGVEAGHQGSWMIGLGYDVLPRRLLEGSRTVYSNLDGTPQTLPSGWVRSGSTTGMTALSGSLRDFDVEWDRETLTFGGEYLFSPNLTFDTDWRHQTKQGGGVTWGSFLANAMQLTRPLDYETDEVTAGVTWAGRDWQLRAEYEGSWFSNKNLGHTWENAFLGPDRGRMAGAPDNKAQYFTLSGNYRFLEHTTASATFATGTAEQDDDYLPFTITPGLMPAALPRTSLDGEIEVTHFNARITSMPLPRLRVTGNYRYHDRDNKTPVASYDFIQADLLPAGITEQNRPYSYERNDYDLAADYRIAGGVTAGLGWERREIDRDLQEVSQTEEDAYWGRLKLRPNSVFELEAKGTRADRDGSDYTQVDYLRLDQNPLMRKYNMADRERDGLEVDMRIQPTGKLSLGIGGEFWDEDFDSSEVGLTSAERKSYSLDANYAHSETLSFYALANRESVTSRQVGAATVVNPNIVQPNWRARNEDEFDLYGAGLRWSGFADNWDLEFDYSYADSTGEIEIVSFAIPSQFPDLRTQRTTAQLTLGYQYSARVRLTGGWLYQDYESDDWSMDGVAPDTLTSVLTWGATSPDYSDNVFLLGFEYGLGIEEEKK